jgi:glycosyltransferase involved in cell wall biosynthesis
MRVLYVNHTSQISGAERSLLTLLAGLPSDISPAVASPEGAFADAVRALGLPVHRLQGTAGSLKLHPVHTAVALAQLARASVALRLLSGRLRIDVLHANSIRAGIISVLASHLGGPPAVVHVRDCLPPSAVSRATRRLIGQGAAAVVSNSRYTEGRFMKPGFPARARVVYNAVDLKRFDPARIERSEARAELGLDPSHVVLAVVAQLTPWKAQDDAVRIVRLLRDAYPGIRLLLVGSAKFVAGATRYDNPAYVRSLERLIDELGVSREVLQLGEREDIARVLRAVDIVLVPSWEEPFGRSVSEALAMEVPVAATSVGGPAELIAHGVEGILLAPRDPERWAEALEPLIGDPELRAEMGRAGRVRGKAQFTTERHVEAVMAVYGEVMAAPAGARNRKTSARGR